MNGIIKHNPINDYAVFNDYASDRHEAADRMNAGTISDLFGDHTAVSFTTADSEIRQIVFKYGDIYRLARFDGFKPLGHFDYTTAAAAAAEIVKAAWYTDVFYKAN